MNYESNQPSSAALLEPKGGAAAETDALERQPVAESKEKTGDEHACRAALLKGINRLLEAALTVKTEEELGAVCLSVAEEVTGSAFGFLGELNAEGMLDDVVISGPEWDACKGPDPSGSRRLPGGFKVHGIYGRVLIDGKAFYTNDPASHPDSVGLPQGHPPLKSFLGVPLIRDGRTVGMVALANREGGYRDEELYALESLAAVTVQAFFRKRAEEALRTGEEKYRKLFEIMDEGFALCELVRDGEGKAVDYRILEVNRAYEKHAGVAPAEVVGRLRSESGPALNPRMLEACTRVVETGSPIRLEQHNEGLGRWIRVGLFPHSGDRFAKLFEDISERKRADEALKKSETRYRQIVETAQEGIWMIDAVDRTVFVNKKMAEMLGCGVEELMGRSPREFMAPEFREKADERLHEHREGVHHSADYRLTRKDSEDLWVHLSSSAIIDGRRYLGSLVMMTDITYRKKAEIALREAKANLETSVAERTAYLNRTIERLEVEVSQRASAEEILRKNEALLGTVLETLPVGVAFVDEDGRPFYLNPALVEIWDGEMTECGACRIWQEGSELSLLSADHPVAVALRNDEPVLGVVQEIETFGGTRKSVITSASPILMPDGSKAGGVFVMQDITHQQDLQKQLLHAQKLDSIGSLAGGVAHDFNNILTIICGYAESVYEQLEGDDGLREELRHVLEAGAKASDLTRKLLTFSRQQVAETAPMSLTATVEEVLSFVSRLIGAHIEVRRQLSPERLTIRGSKGQIEQVLVNIVLNARDAIADAGTVTVRTGKVKAAEAAVALPEEGTYAFVEIADSGVGIPPQNLDRIFEPYFTTKEQGKGTGLGMAIAYGIIRQHRGTITVTSAVGQGTTFTVYLPLTSSRAKALSEPGQGELPRGNETVLVVEDEAMVRSYADMTLRKAGYCVVTACDGAEALETIREHPVDIVLADVIMPGMNGMEMYRQMREFLPGLKVVFASGYSADIVTAKGIAEGEFCFLQKPVTKATLLTTIREVLDGEGGGIVAADETV